MLWLTEGDVFPRGRPLVLRTPERAWMRLNEQPSVSERVCCGHPPVIIRTLSSCPWLVPSLLKTLVSLGCHRNLTGPLQRGGLLPAHPESGLSVRAPWHLWASRERGAGSPCCHQAPPSGARVPSTEPRVAPPTSPRSWPEDTPCGCFLGRDLPLL